jgi:serine/threonine protein kinase
LLIHRGFKTSNVLINENFIAKVSDAGIDRLVASSKTPVRRGGLTAVALWPVPTKIQSEFLSEKLESCNYCSLRFFLQQKLCYNNLLH